MKRICVLCGLMVLLFASGAMAGGIYRNNTLNPTALDSISIPFQFLNDSLQPVRKATHDSLVIVVRYPSGVVCYQAHVDSNDIRIIETLQSGSYWYSFNEQVSNIDGDGREGNYTWTLMAIHDSPRGYSPYNGTAPIYNQSFLAKIDSAMPPYQFGDSGKPLVPCERTDYVGSGAALGAWKFVSGDSISTKSQFDIDNSGGITSADNGPRLIIQGDSTVCMHAHGGGAATIMWTRVDTNAIDCRAFANFSFWVWMDLGFGHEGSADKSNTTTRDGQAGLGYFRMFMTSDSTLTNYKYFDFVDTTIARGPNHVLLSKDDFSTYGTISWPSTRSGLPFNYIGFMLYCDSTPLAIRAMIDDIRYNVQGRPAFIFRFDDGSLTQLHLAAPVLSDYGYEACAMVCAYDIDHAPTGGYLDSNQVDSLYNAGWDICNHGYTASQNDIPLDTIQMSGRLTDSAYWKANDRQKINYGQEYLIRHGWKRGAAIFAWPYNCYDTIALRTVAERHVFASGGKSFNRRDYPFQVPSALRLSMYTSPYYMLSPNHDGPAYRIDSLKALVNAAINRGSSFILGMHSFVGHLHHDGYAVAGDIASKGSWQSTGAGKYTELDETVADDDATKIWIVNPSPGDSVTFRGNIDSTISCRLDGTWSSYLDSIGLIYRYRFGGTWDPENASTVIIRFDTSAAHSSSVTGATLSPQGPTSWITDTCYVRFVKTSRVDSMRFTMRSGNGLTGETDTFMVSYLGIYTADDSSGNTTQTDSSYLRAVCEFLRGKGSSIEVKTFSEWLQQASIGGQLDIMHKKLREARDSLALIGPLKDSLNNLLANMGPLAALSHVPDSVNAALDTLQNQDNWIAKQADLQKDIDTTNAILDTLQLYDTQNHLYVHVSQMGSGVITPTAIATDAITSDKLDNTADAEIRDNVWSGSSRTLTSPQTFNLTGDITGNLSGSVGSVTGAVGSVTGNVGGSVASVTGAVGSVTGNVGGNVSGTVGGLAAGQYTKIGDSVWLRTVRTLTALGDTATLCAMRDSINGILDSLQLQDNWVAKETTIQKGVDTANAILDTLQNGSSSLRATGGGGTTDTAAIKLAMRPLLGDSLKSIKDTVRALIDTLNNGSSSLRATAGSDTVAIKLAMRPLIGDSLKSIKDSLQAALDTLQNQDNWIAKATDLQKAIDSINAVLDSLQLQDDWAAKQATLTNVRDTANAIIDTAQNQDNWIAKAAELQKAIDSINASLDTLQNASSTLRAAGGSATIDTMQVYRAAARVVHDTNLATYSDVAGMCGSGSGTQTDTVYVIDTSGTDQVVVGAKVTIKNSGQTAELGTARTVSGGAAILGATDPSTGYKYIAFLPGYTFSIKSVTTGSGTVQVDTIKGYDNPIGAPSSPHLCRVYGWLYDLAGVCIDSAAVKAWVATQPLKYGSTIISPYSQATVSDAAGYWYLDLYPNAILTPTTTKYDFEIRYGSGTVLHKSVAVPDSTTWLLSW